MSASPKEPLQQILSAHANPSTGRVLTDQHDLSDMLSVPFAQIASLAGAQIQHSSVAHSESADDRALHPVVELSQRQDWAVLPRIQSSVWPGVVVRGYRRRFCAANATAFGLARQVLQWSLLGYAAPCIVGDGRGSSTSNTILISLGAETLKHLVPAIATSSVLVLPSGSERIGGAVSELLELVLGERDPHHSGHGHTLGLIASARRL